MSKQQVQPNHFELTGMGASGQQVQVVYDVAAFDGLHHLNYQDERGSKTFIGEQIEVHLSPLGRLLTVGVFQSLDAGETTFTLLLPTINLRGMSQQPYQTLGIYAASHGILPEQLPDLTYSVVQLQGTASLVEA